MEKIKEILRESALTSMLSDMEIEEIADSVNGDITEHIESEIETQKEEIEAAFDRERHDLKRQISELKGRSLPSETLEDEMTSEWVKQNWEAIKEMQRNGIPERKKHRRIVLVGRAASGKDFLRKKLEDSGYVYGVSYTTRPPREGEIDGKDYRFLSPEKFQEMVDRNQFYEHVGFNGWRYGTSREQFYRDDVFIMTPHGLSRVHPSDRKDSLVIFLDMPLEIRRERLSQRSDADRVERRLEADDKDFAGFNNYDVRITNPDF